MQNLKYYCNRRSISYTKVYPFLVSTTARPTTNTTLLIHNYPISFTPGLNHTCFTNLPPPPRSFTSSSRTSFTDYSPDRFF